MNKAKKNSLDHNRRKFLRTSAGVGAGVAAAVTLPGIASTETEAEVASSESTSQKGYRLTPHIAAYYETTTS